MKILFWGSPTFALPSLRALGDEGHEIVAVVTKPDRPAGRGRKSRASPVKEAALLDGYTVLGPVKPVEEDFLARARGLQPELSVVVAYGHILRPEILNLASRGCVNVHASLLPELRGAAPVNWAIIRGHEVTGVTVMRMVEAMDAGPVLLQVEEPIGEEETASDLYDRLSEVGAAALVEAVALLEAGLLEEREQDEALATYAPKLDRERARLDWEIDAGSVSRWIRGLDAVPGAWSLLEGNPVKLFRARELPSRQADGEPGTIVEASSSAGLVVATGRGVVSVREVQPAGKRRMTTEEWVRGRGVQVGQRFE